MQNNNYSSIKRECILAVLIPNLCFGIYQLIAHNNYSLVIMLSSIMIALTSLYYVFKLLSEIENTNWHDQLSSVIKKSSTPILMADNEFNIIYKNDCFQRKALITLTERTNSLIVLVNQYCDNTIPNLGNFLNSIETKFKAHLTWAGCEYECYIMPILSPHNSRSGYLIEFIEIKEGNKNNISEEINMQILDQLDIGLMCLNEKDNIGYLNTSVKILLTRNQNWLQSKDPQIDVNSLEGKSISTLLSAFTERSVDFLPPKSNTILPIIINSQAYDLHFQPLINSDQEITGTIIIWLESKAALSAKALDSITHQVQGIKQDLTQFYVQLENTNKMAQEMSQGDSHAVFEALDITQKAVINTINHAQTMTLVAHQLHENHSNLTQLQEFMKKFAKLQNEKNNESGQVFYDIVLLLDSVKSALTNSKVKLSEQIKNTDIVNEQWNHAFVNLQKYYDSLDLTQTDSPIRKNLQFVLERSLHIHDVMEDLLILIQKMGNGEDYATLLKQLSAPVYFDEAKRQAEDVLLEDMKIV